MVEAKYLTLGSVRTAFVELAGPDCLQYVCRSSAHLSFYVCIGGGGDSDGSDWRLKTYTFSPTLELPRDDHEVVVHWMSFSILPTNLYLAKF